MAGEQSERLESMLFGRSANRTTRNGNPFNSVLTAIPELHRYDLDF